MQPTSLNRKEICQELVDKHSGLFSFRFFVSYFLIAIVSVGLRVRNPPFAAECRGSLGLNLTYVLNAQLGYS